MPCTCEGVEFGSYANSIAVQIPPHMAEYREARLREGLSGEVGLDNCIRPEVERLWGLGVVTLGSCCGHRAAKGFIQVRDDFGPVMEAEGYERDPAAPGAYVWPRANSQARMR